MIERGRARKSSKEELPLDGELLDIRRQHAIGAEMLRSDLADPVRGPVWKRVQALRYAALEKEINGNPELANDVRAVADAFAAHFGDDEARKYRLYHALAGSSPYAGVDRFDAEGGWSIATAMERLAKEHGIAA